MTFNEKAYYCSCISSNRFKYSSHGREANRSFHRLLVPSRQSVPSWVDVAASNQSVLGLSTADLPPKPSSISSELVPLIDLFEMHNGINPSSLPTEDAPLDHTYVPVVRPSKTQKSSYVEYVSALEVEPEHVFPKGTLYISTNGQGSHTYAYVSTFDFIPNTDVVALTDRSGKGGVGLRLKNCIMRRP